MNTHTTRVLAATAAALVILVVVALALSGSGRRVYEPDTPEATLQTFLQALFDDDVDEAETVLSPELAARCMRSDLRFTPASFQDVAEITDVDTAGDRAEITVVFSEETGLFADGYQTEHVFELDRIDGEWQITALDERFGCR